MATIVTQYNPWREQLAVNFLGGLLNNMIQRNQQRADNRIQNRAIADWVNSNEPATTNYLATQQNPQTLTDSWTNAFRQNGNELANFDMNMASIAPQVQAQPYNRVQILNNLARTIGSNRDYQALNTEQMMKLVNPYIEAAENARKDYITRQLADRVMNADNYRDKLNELTGGVIRGEVPLDIYNGANNNYFNDYKYHNLSALETANNAYRDKAFTEDSRRFNLNFEEGQRQFDANNALANRQLNTQNNQFQQNLQWLQTQDSLNRAERNSIVAREVDENGNVWNVTPTGQRFPALLPDGTQQKANPQQVHSTRTGKNPYEWTKFDDNKLAEYDSNIKSIENAITTIEEKKEELTNEKDIVEYNKQIDELKKLLQAEQKAKSNYINRRQAEYNSYYQTHLPNQTQGTNNTTAQRPARGRTIATEILGGDYKISPNGEYMNNNRNREGHPHRGVDYLVSNAQVAAPYSLGNWRVKQAGEDKKLGYYVTIETNFNGKHYELIMGHLAKGSLRVKKDDTVYPGDVLGVSGNTGRVRGVNGGYHLHVQAKVDGKLVDPEKLWTYVDSGNTSQTQNNIISAVTPVPVNPKQNNTQNKDNNNIISAVTPEPASQENTQSVSQPETQTQDTTQPVSQPQTQIQEKPENNHQQEQEIDNLPDYVMWYNPSTGKFMTEEEYNDFSRLYNEEELGEKYPNQYLTKNGFILVHQKPQNNNTTPTPAQQNNSPMANNSAMQKQLDFLNGYGSLSVS